jgi:hypothetical protein
VGGRRKNLTMPRPLSVSPPPPPIPLPPTAESDSSVAKSVSTAIESSFPAIAKPEKMKDKLTMAKKR